MQKATEIFEKYHRAVAVAIYGKDSLPSEAWDLAVDLGLVDPTASGETLSGQIYLFGVMAAHMDQGERQSRYGDSSETWLEELMRNPVPMTAIEDRAAHHARHNAAQYVVGLGRRAAATLGGIVREEDKKLSTEFRATIRDVIGANMGDSDSQDRLKERGVSRGLPDSFFDNAFRGSMNRIRSDLGHATGEWTRDLERIARTESVEAFNQGMADDWQEQELELAEEQERPPRKVRAYRVLTPTACKQCERLYMSGGEVRIFDLDELVGNGTNFKLKRADWKPIVGATHPFCACDLQRLPEYIRLPKGWRSGDTAPSVVGSDGRLVLSGAA